MAIWGALGRAALQLGVKVAGDATSQELGTAGPSLGGELQTPGFHKSGNVSDERGGGFLSKTNSFLGSQTGSIVKGVGSQFLGDYRQRRANKNRFSDLKDEGLTPQEIMGGGGGSVQAQGNTLGSGPMQQAQNQQAFQADQAQKERDNKLNIAKIQVGPAKTQARTGIDRLQMDQYMNYEKAQKIIAEVAKIDLENSNFFAKIAAQMGPENIKAALVMYKNGINFQTILQALKLPDRNQEIVVQDILNEIQKENSFIRKEYEGLIHGITDTYEKYIGNFKGLGKQLDIKGGQFGRKYGNPNVKNPLSPSFGRVWK